MKRYVVDGQEIRVEFRSFRKYLWLAAGFEVHVGDIVFLPYERLRANTTLTYFDFEASGRHRFGVVRSLRMSQSLRRKTEYEIAVDGETVAQGTQTMRGWYMGYLVLPLVCIGMLCSLVFRTVVLQVILEAFVIDR